MRTQKRLITEKWLRRARILPAWLLALSLGVPAHAQPAAQELRLDPITVTATRTPRRVSTVADSVEVITKEQIDALLPGDFNEVLREATGAVLEQSGSRGGSTAFRIRGSEDNFTSFLIDGFKVSPPIGITYDPAHLSPEWIGRAEILRGPQSTLYGSDAAAGVVNLLLDLPRPGERPSAEASARHGSFSTYEEAVKVKGGTEKGAYLGTLSRLDTDGRFPNDGYYRTVATAAFDHFPTERAKVHLLYQYNRSRFDNTSDAGATNSDLRLEAPFTDRELNTFQRITDQLAGLRLELRPAEWLEYVPRVSYFERENLFLDAADALDAARPFFSPFKSDTTETRLLVDNQVNLRLKGGPLGLAPVTASVTTLGFAYEEERFFQERFDGKTDQKRLARSLYAQEQLTLLRDLTLTGGIRVDDFDVGKDEVTFKISGSYRIRGTGTKLRGAVGDGVKRPSFSDLFGIAIFAGNPRLGSERQESWEAGVDQTFLGRRLRLSATYYQSVLKDLIAFGFAPFPNGTNFENISEARLKGAEFSLTLLDFHDFTLRLNYNTLDTVVLDDRDGAGGFSFRQGEELLRRPNWWWSGSLTYHPDRLRATVRIHQVSSRLDRDFRPFVDGSNGGSARTVNNPGHTKIDLAVALDLIKDRKPLPRAARPAPVRGLALELKVNNLLDEDFDEVFGFSAPGVQWFVGFRLFL